MSNCVDKICYDNKICNPKTGRCVKKSGKIGKTIRSRSPSIKEFDPKEFLLSQKVEGLKSYIVSRDKDRILKGWKSLKKSDLVEFILKNIDVETGAIFRSKSPIRSRSLSRSRSRSPVKKFTVSKKNQTRLEYKQSETFGYSYKGIYHMDIYRDISKNTVSVLLNLVKFLNSQGIEIKNAYKMKKAELIRNIQRSIRFE